MKHIIFFGLFIISSNSFGQNTNWTGEQLKKYFSVDTYQANIQIQGKDSALLFIYPAIKIKGEDKIANFIKSKENRFQYLLVNRTTFEKIYNPLYPDTSKIRNNYADDLAKNKLFIYYLNETLKPLETKTVKPKLSFSKEEVSKVASHFFYSDSLFADNSLSSHICVGLNGIKEAKFARDYTLLEAFCFEAIFYYLRDEEKSGFNKNFMLIVKKLKKQYLDKNKTTEGMLKFIQINTFLEMSQDAILMKRLDEYYAMNKSNLNFSIK